MRILHVSHELPPYELAGTAIYTWNIARAQAEDHDVFVFARLQDPKQRPYQAHTEVRDGLTIRFVNKADLEWSPFEHSYVDPRMEKMFRDFLEEVRPDVVHFQHIVGLGLGVLGIPRSLGLTSVYTLHDFWPMCPMGQRMCYTDNVICDPIDFGKCGPCVFGEGWKESGPREAAILAPEGVTPARGVRASFNRHFRRRYSETPGRIGRRYRAWLRAAQWTARDLLRPAGNGRPPATANPFEHRFHRLREALLGMDLLVTPSAFLRDEFIRHFRIPPGKIIHSANGMDFSYVKTLPKPPAERLRVGFVGSIIRTKGVHVLVDGFLQAADSCPDLELHVHGAPNRWSGDYEKSLRDRATGHPAAARVFFHGRFDNRRIGEILAGIDVLVLPSIWFENAPLTLNEAAMTRTPILVSDRGGMLEFARANRYGRTFTLGDPASLAAVLREISGDRGRMRTLAGDPPPIKPVRENAVELVGIYHRLRSGTWVAPTIEEQTETRGGCVVKV